MGWKLCAHASARRRRDADRAAGQGVLRQLRLLKVRGGCGFLPAGFRHKYQEGLGGPLAAPPTCGDAFGRVRVSRCLLKLGATFLSLIALNQHT